jgi:hypothetical protein
MPKALDLNGIKSIVSPLSAVSPSPDFCSGKERSFHVVVDDEEQACSLFHSAIEGHPLFLYNLTKAITSRSA